MPADSKAKDYHWFQMYAIRNRVDAGIIMNIYTAIINVRFMDSWRDSKTFLSLIMIF